MGPVWVHLPWSKDIPCGKAKNQASFRLSGNKATPSGAEARRAATLRRKCSMHTIRARLVLGTNWSSWPVCCDYFSRFLSSKGQAANLALTLRVSARQRQGQSGTTQQVQHQLWWWEVEIPVSYTKITQHLPGVPVQMSCLHQWHTSLPFPIHDSMAWRPHVGEYTPFSENSSTDIEHKSIIFRVMRLSNRVLSAFCWYLLTDISPCQVVHLESHYSKDVLSFV